VQSGRGAGVCFSEFSRKKSLHGGRGRGEGAAAAAAAAAAATAAAGLFAKYQASTYIRANRPRSGERGFKTMTRNWPPFAPAVSDPAIHPPRHE